MAEFSGAGLIAEVEPEFRDEFARIGAEQAGTPGMVAGSEPGPELAEGLLNAGLIERLAEPVLKAASRLILQRVQAEATIILNAEKVAHPDWDLSAVTKFLAALTPPDA